MKKTLALLLSLFIVFGLCGCKSNKTVSEVSSEPEVIVEYVDETGEEISGSDVSGNTSTVSSDKTSKASTKKPSSAQQSSSKAESGTTAAAGGSITAVSPVNCTVDFHNKEQQKYASTGVNGIQSIASGKKELSRPEPVEFKWDFSFADGSVPQSCTLSLSESPNMANAATYSGYKDCKVYNLKIATTYYWTVSANGVTSAVASFKTTETGPRNLYVDGITNVRDLGGYMTSSGKRVNQGLVFRTARLNKSSTSTVVEEISQKGKDTMLNELGVRTELDLRNPNNNFETGGLTASVLSGVNYRVLPIKTSFLISENVDYFKEIFSLLSDRNNYPVFFHCHIGTDRTGLVAYVLGAVLGVSEDDLARDYLFSNFGTIDNTPRSYAKFKELGYYYELNVNRTEPTLKERAYNYLVELGIPASDIDAYINIMLG